MDFDAMKQRANYLQLNDKVTFTGMLQGKTLTDTLADCDFMVLSSNYETQGVVLLEAFACGLPVVRTCIPGHSSAVLPPALDR